MTFDEERAQEYRDEARQDEAEENECPCCHGQLTGQSFADEGRVVESGQSCECGFARGISYGQGYLELPDGFREDENGNIKMEDDDDD